MSYSEIKYCESIFNLNVAHFKYLKSFTNHSPFMNIRMNGLANFGMNDKLNTLPNHSCIRAFVNGPTEHSSQP